MPPSRLLSTALTALTSLTGLAACATEGNTNATGKPNVVVSTQSWALVAKAIAGDKAPVVAIVGAGRDPHEYELTSRDTVAVEKATVAVFNGDRYDPFIEKALAGARGARVIRADQAKIVSQGLVPQNHKELHNPHLFFNFAVVDAVASELADELGREDPASKGYYEQNLHAFHESLHGFADQLQLVGEHHPGLKAAQVESVGQYLLDYLDATDVTPGGYRDAVAKAVDPPLADQVAVVSLLKAHGADLLVNNPQDTNSATNELVSAAKSGQVPIISVGETPNIGQDTYADWLKQTVDGFVTALGGPVLPPDYHHEENESARPQPRPTN